MIQILVTKHILNNSHVNVIGKVAKQ